MKNILCKLGFHRPYEFVYLRETKYRRNGKKYYRNYFICKRCGKRLGIVQIIKTGGKNNG